MSTHAHRTDEAPLRQGLYALGPFDRLMAPVVASWPVSDHELFWLAPKSVPPLTAAKVVAWTAEQGSPLLFSREGHLEPLGYVELNPMPLQRYHFWMGHCIINPAMRGQGLGAIMVQMMLDEAFLRRRATRVSLVVFPENVPAIRCYRRVGFVDAGEQTKSFPTAATPQRMLRMTITPDQRPAISVPSADPPA